MRELIAAALSGHRLDTMNQDSGNHCMCGSDSRFDQRDGDHPWASIDEHRADLVLRALAGKQAQETACPKCGDTDGPYLRLGSNPSLSGCPRCGSCF